MLGTFMEVLDTSVANVALPHIAGSLSATPEEATWVLTSYLVSNAIILPIGLLALLLVLSFIEDPPYLERSRFRRMDYLGFAFMSLWLGALQIMLDKGQEEDWFSSSRIRVLAVVSVIAMVCFVVREL